MIKIFYELETWSLTLRELRLVKNRLLKRTFGERTNNRSQEKFT
jgi:hypothetical protein